VRPLSGATVSVPLNWSEVSTDFDPHEFNIFTVPERLKQAGDLFGGVLRKGIDIRKCLKALTIAV
jgi:bifunctional non-homologous end joining protein LigD